jgi:hypothetical protein
VGSRLDGTFGTYRELVGRSFEHGLGPTMAADSERRGRAGDDRRQRVSASYFRVLGVTILGRDFGDRNRAMGPGW